MEGQRTSSNEAPAADAAISDRILLAGQTVDVIDATERRSTPFASPTTTAVLSTVPEGQLGQVLRVVSPTPEVVPRAHAEESVVPSPRRRRGTPTAAAASRRQQHSHRVTYEDLVSRPRSNPRSRTPMRYESPLEHAAFRHGNNNNAANNDDDGGNNNEARTISIRPTAGLGVGVVRAAPERIRLDDTAQRPQPITLGKSSKQGPSHRKARRWNNDNFVNTHKDLANSSSAKGRIAAEILAAAKADARHFLPIYDPAEKKRPDQIQKFMEDAKYRDVRDQFFRGELHASTNTTIGTSHHTHRKAVSSDLDNLSPEHLYQRIDGRLRRVVAKACENSAPACKIVESFEDYLIHVFDVDNTSEDATAPMYDDLWRDVLLEKPIVTMDTKDAPPTISTGKAKTVTFLFDGNSSSGGFHRLLVHAVSHFHCLKAKTTTQNENQATGSKASRVLTVQGVLRGGKHRLLDHLAFLQDQKQKQRQ